MATYSVMDALISLHAKSLEIWRNTPGAEDSRGFPAQVWAKSSDVVGMIQAADTIRQENTGFSLVGVYEVGDYVGFFDKDDSILVDDQVRDASVYYRVLRVQTLTLFGLDSHIEAHLRKEERG